MIARHLHISGRVQGVFFRASTRDKARQLGVSGWVKNLPDGRVEAWLQGPDSHVTKLVQWCHSGPPAAQVSDLDIDEVEPNDDLSRFEIRYT